MDDEQEISREEIVAACEGDGFVVHVGDVPPFGPDEGDGLVAVKIVGPPGDPTLFVIGASRNAEKIELLATQIVEGFLGGTVRDFTRFH